MEYIALLMFALLILLLLTGYPVAFVLGAISLLFGSIYLGFDFFQLLVWFWKNPVLQKNYSIPWDGCLGEFAEGWQYQLLWWVLC